MGEDIISKFSLAIPIEMYMEDVMGFQGDRELFSKFGLQIQNSYKLTVAQARWETEVKTQFDNVNITGNTEAAFDIVNYIRPREGDIVYDPMTKFVMEIKFIDHDSEFYQIGKNYLYVLSCEAFQYGHEDFATGIPEIDLINDLNADLLDFQLLQEDGSKLLQEECNYSLILEDTDSVDSAGSPQMQYGEDFSGQVQVVVENPFGEFA